jgi:hypothetical protein
MMGMPVIHVVKTGCHVKTIPQENHHFLLGAMFTIPRKMGGKNGIVLPTLIINH